MGVAETAVAAGTAVARMVAVAGVAAAAGVVVASRVEAFEVVDSVGARGGEMVAEAMGEKVVVVRAVEVSGEGVMAAFLAVHVVGLGQEGAWAVGTASAAS